MLRASFLAGFAVTVSAYAIAALNKRLSKQPVHVPVQRSHRGDERAS